MKRCIIVPQKNSQMWKYKLEPMLIKEDLWSHQDIPQDDFKTVA